MKSKTAIAITKVFPKVQKLMHELLIVSTIGATISTAGSIATSSRLTVHASEPASEITVPISEMEIETENGVATAFYHTTSTATLQNVTDGIYPAAFKVYKMDFENDLVYIVSSTGFTYSFYGCEDYCIDDYVTCIMGDNSTTEITDDYIIDVKYSGFWDNRTETEN